MKYPDYVKQFRPKGTVIKLSNGTYYAYYATSKRVPDKSYPVQVIKGLAGTVDQFGFHPMTRAVVDTEHVIVRECGFTNYLLKFEEEYIEQCKRGTKKDRRNLYRSMIVYLSNNSYLCDDPQTTVYPPGELVSRFGIGIPNQVTAIQKMCEQNLSELEPLKYICSVKMGNRMFVSELTEPQKSLLEELGVDEDDIR